MKPGRLPGAGALALGLLLTACDMNEMIFFPEPLISATPQSAGLAFEDVYLTTSDNVRINGWYVPAPPQADGSPITLLWFHGNAGNLSDRVRQLRALHDHLAVNIFMLDYRQYGRSEGEVSETGTYLDAEAALAYLRDRGDQGRVVYYGQSLGSAVAVELARRARPDGLILEAPFLSVREMAKVVVPFLPVGGLISTQYDSLSKIGAIDAPLLILHGDRDEVVPYAHGKRLFAAANEPKRFYTISGAHHNDTYIAGGAGYVTAFRDFLASLPS
ncbi:MAG: alpha/beta hydrolase [Nitrospirae bacterium]|nr:alpha/beta hydrolase [Nitrospirota bacterium]